MLSQGDIIPGVALPLLAAPVTPLEQVDSRYRAVRSLSSEGGVALVAYEFVSVMVMSFDCELFKVLHAMHAGNHERFSPADIAHVAAVRPIPEGFNEAGSIRAGKKYGAVFVPVMGNTPEGYVDLYTFQPFPLRQLILVEDTRISGLSLPGRAKLTTFLAQFLGDDDRRENTNVIPNAHERTLLDAVKRALTV